jgi:hypothetical protein
MGIDLDMRQTAYFFVRQLSLDLRGQSSVLDEVKSLHDPIISYERPFDAADRTRRGMVRNHRTG